MGEFKNCSNRCGVFVVGGGKSKAHLPDFPALLLLLPLPLLLFLFFYFLFCKLNKQL